METEATIISKTEDEFDEFDEFDEETEFDGAFDARI